MRISYCSSDVCSSDRGNRAIGSGPESRHLMVHHLASLEGCAMEQILHGSAHTIEAVRRAIQHSEKSLRVLAKRYGINQKTVAKWKTRTAVKDLPTGPRDAHSTICRSRRSEEHTSELQSLMRTS